MKNRAWLRAALISAIVVSVAALAPRFAGNVLTGAPARASVREIHLVAKDMTFYIDGREDPNPTIQTRPGERIKLVLRNVDAGMSHDFAVRSWSIGTRLLEGKGQDAIEFTVPETRGSHQYSCTPHSAMMRGIIEVE
jgi:plastocyanin